MCKVCFLETFVVQQKFIMVSCLLKISTKTKSISPEAHVDGQDFHQIVCSELVRIIWVIWPLDTHYSTKLLNLFSSTSNHIILNRIENQEILSCTVIQSQTVKVKLFSSQPFGKRLQRNSTSHSCPCTIVKNCFKIQEVAFHWELTGATSLRILRHQFNTYLLQVS